MVPPTTHTQKNDVESNGGSLENVAEIFVLFFCGVQLVLRSGVLTILELDEVDVTPSFVRSLGHSAYLSCFYGCRCMSDGVFIQFVSDF